MDLFRSHVLICAGTGCTSSGSALLYDRFEKLIAEKGVYYQLYTGAFELE